MRHGVCCLPFFHDLRICRSPVFAKKSVAARVETVHRSIHGIYCIVVSSLTVLCFVIDGRAGHLDLACA